jgi:hypothetical protein
LYRYTAVVVLLDEMDQLVSKAQGILYELFGLPTLASSRCVVVGVANGINLVEVTLPRQGWQHFSLTLFCTVQNAFKLSSQMEMEMEMVHVMQSSI